MKNIVAVPAVRVNGRCVRCRSVHTALLTLSAQPSRCGTPQYENEKGQPVMWVSTIDGMICGKPYAKCGCGAPVLLRTVRGKISKHKCDDACAWADGDIHVCKCSCGGLNHGSMNVHGTGKNRPGAAGG